MIQIPEKPYQYTPEEIADLLQTSEIGLDRPEIEERQKQFGRNEISDKKKKPIWELLFKQFNNLMVYILMVAATISYFTANYIDVYVISAIIFINIIIGFLQEYKAENALQALKSLLVPKCKVLRNGKLKTINSVELVPGDVMVLEEGDLIPADGILFTIKNTRTMEASLTGEATPVNKNNVPCNKDTAIADRSNMVWKSTFLSGGSAKAWVTGTGINTHIGQIAQTLKTLPPQKTNFQIKADQLAKLMALIAISIAVILFLLGYFLQDITIEELLLISIAALVSTIPEGLPAVLSIVLAIGSNRMSKKNVIIREFSATESLGSVTTIVTDKTGTLTQNAMTIRKIWQPGANAIQVTGEGWEPEGDLIGRKEDIESIRELLEIAAHCHHSSVSKNKKGKY
ncbi:MAG: HAD-IC family P-type ATPase [Cyclobacteriaceae bacterium]